MDDSKCWKGKCDCTRKCCTCGQVFLLIKKNSGGDGEKFWCSQECQPKDKNQNV